MALFRKLFYRKPPDGLLEICERVYVFDCCFTTEAFEEERDYFGYVGGIVTQLKEYYPDASILAFNFREGETQSQIGSALSEYDMTIMEYPRHYEGCPLLPMEVMHHFLRSSESWFSLGMQNLLLMHCERGGWPVLAFMLAALLIYRKHYSGELKTLDMVYKQAPRELLHLMSPLNPIPSQLRYLQYVSRRNVATQWPPLDRALTLDCIILRMFPNFDGEGGCRPMFRIYGQDPCLVYDRSPKVLFSTPKQSRTVRHYKQAECSIVKVDINCHIQGDVVLECISLHNDMQREVMMFRVMFNTAFIRSNILMLNLDEIDILWDAKDLFPKDFRAEVLFSEMDSVASKVSVDTSCFEDKDGLPVEAFVKVQEIFNSVDWLSPERDTAVEALQQLAASSTILEAQVNQSLAELEAKSPVKSPTDLSPKLSPNADVSINQVEPCFSPTISGAIISSKQTLIPFGEYSPPTSTSHYQPSEEKTLHLSSDQQSEPNEIGIGKDGFPLSEAIPLYPENLISAPPSQSTKDADVVPGGSLLSPAPTKSGAILSSNQTLFPSGDYSPPTSTSHYQPSEENILHLSPNQQSEPNEISIGKDGFPLSEAIPLYPKNLISAPPSQQTKDAEVVPEGSLLSPAPSPITPPLEDKVRLLNARPLLPLLTPETPSASTPALNDDTIIMRDTAYLSAESPEDLDQVIEDEPPKSEPFLIEAHRVESPPPPPPIHSSPLVDVVKSTEVGSFSPSTTISSNLNDIQVTDGASPSPKTDATLKIAPPPESLPLLPSPFKENSEGVVKPSPPTFTSYLTDSSAANTSTSCSPPPPPPPLPPVSPHESSSIGGGLPLLVPPPTPSPSPSLPSSPLKDQYAPEVVHSPPSTPPLRDILVTKPVPCPPPPPPPLGPLNESITGGESTPPYSGDAASSLAPPLRDSLVTGLAPCPPPPQPLKEISDGVGPSCSPPPLHSEHSSSNLQTLPSPSLPPFASRTTRSSSVSSALPPLAESSSIPSIPPPPFSPTTSSSVLSVPPPLASPRSSFVPLAPPPPSSPRSSSVPSAPPPPGSPTIRSSSVPSAPPPPPPVSPRSSFVPSAPPPPASPRSSAIPPPPASHTSSSLPGPPSPPPPSILSPGTRGKSLLSRTTSRNNQIKKLKPLHWLKISRAVSGSLWAEAQKSGEASRAPEIDISELETLFSAAAPNSDGGIKTGARGSMGNKPEKVQLIDHRRAYNCEIMLSKVKMPLPDMLSSVLALEDSGLDVDQVENLIKFCPTKEEMELLKGYKGDKDKLGKCEQFFLELMQVPRTEFKLRVYSFKLQFHTQVSDLRNNLSIVNSASDEIRGSSKLKRIMQTILNLGNALNQGTARGSAVGFRLDSLLKLIETRARNNKMTLMHYLCKMLSDQLPDLLDFWKDLSSLELASKIQLKFLAEEMQSLNKGLEKVMQELTLSESDGPVSDQFCKALKEFLCFSEGEVRSLASLYAGVGRNVDSLINYFGEDPARCPFEQVISTLTNFVRMFKQAHEENCKQIESDKKKAEKEAMERGKKNTLHTEHEHELLQSEVK